MLLCYVDGILSIVHDSHATLIALTSTFRLKDKKIDEPGIYLGAKLGKMDVNGVRCWTMSAEQYVIAFVQNVEDCLAKRGLCHQSKCYTPLASEIIQNLK
jgi:hypothetical protein